jgi:hypothetical protein
MQHGADSVTFEFSPRIDHGGLSLYGRLAGDSATGRWWQRAFGGGATGHFVMRRLSSRAVHVALPPTPPAPPPFDTTQLGAFRVRIFDRASKRYFVTEYDLRVGPSWISADFRTGKGPDGWGPVVRREQGHFGVYIKFFQCGDKFWALDREIERPFTVRKGETTSISIAVDVPKLKASPTYDNRAGLRCLIAPGDKP